MQHRSSDYRTMAALCLEIADQMSLEHRAHLIDVAQKWLELAQKGGEQFPEGSNQAKDQ